MQLCSLHLDNSSRRLKNKHNNKCFALIYIGYIPIINIVFSNRHTQNKHTIPITLTKFLWNYESLLYTFQKINTHVWGEVISIPKMLNIYLAVRQRTLSFSLRSSLIISPCQCDFFIFLNACFCYGALTQACTVKFLHSV